MASLKHDDVSEDDLIIYVLCYQGFAMSESQVSSAEMRCVKAGRKSLSVMGFMRVWVNIENGTFARSCLFPAPWLSRMGEIHSWDSRVFSYP